VNDSFSQSYLTLDDDSLHVTLSNQGRALNDGDPIPHWHQGIDLNLEMSVTFDPEVVRTQTQVGTDALYILVTATSDLTKRSQYYLIDADPSGQTWTDILLDGSLLGGQVVIRVSLCPSSSTKRFSKLAPQILNSIVESQFKLVLEGNGSRIQVETFEFDGSRNYPKSAYWRIETDFPENAESLDDYELNSSIWISVNSLKERELAEPVARTMLKTDFQVRILTECLSIPGSIEFAVSRKREASEKRSSLTEAIRTIVLAHFDQIEETAVQHSWRTRESEIRARIQGGSA